MYHLRKLKSMLLLLLVAVSARAQIEHGKVYNFVNIANSGKSMVWVSGDELTIADTKESDNKQLWYVVKNEDNSYSLRNLDNGKYLRSPNATGNERWTTVETADDNCKFECVVAGNGYYSLRATNSKGDEHEKHYMHYSSANGGVNRIVCWSTTAPSQWTINEVTVSAKDLEYIGDKAIYQTALNNLFSDKACTQLKKSFANEAAVTADADYLALPATLREMVLKVYREAWTEANYDGTKPAWGAEYAKKYRVQLYEPYNEPEAAAKAIGINAHTNMNNPTGIFSGAHEVLYIMVEGTIKEGASLYLASITGHNRLEGYDEGILLNEGLNIIPTEAAGNNYFINYVVNTFDTSNGKRGKEAKSRRLSDFPDLKIHIEGGYINGYWNKMGDDLYTADTNDSWNYIEQRATQTDVTVLGEYMTLQFPLRDEDTEQYVDKEDGNKVKWNKGLGSYLNELVDIEDVINSWDNVMMWERFLLGLLSEKTTLDVAKNPKSHYSSQANVVGYIGDETDGGYADYYNVHGLALGVGGNSYMYGSWNHSGYHFNTMGSIIKDIPTNVGSHWGPAHEIGHQHQSLITMRGETEVSNNLFSNVVLWYFGETTSRVNGDNGSLENVLKNFNKEDGNYLTNNIWGMTHMYYKLFLYYHVLGHNPKFYPRLFEMLRQDPIEGMGGTVDGAKAQLHLYKMVCQAAEEDLTEFFRAHGFFTPLDGFLMGDYGESTYYMTQEQIDAAIAEVKAHNWSENIAVLFINDATPDGAITSHKGGQLSLYDRDGDDLDKDGDRDEPYPFPLAEMGGYATFEESVTDGAELQYTVSGKNVTVNAGGGVGYAIYNKEGELIAFSNKKTFTVSDECATALMWGNATMKVVNADNTTVEVEVDDAVASKHELLGNLIAEVEAELQYDDPTRVGYYIAGALDNLRTICVDAKIVYNNQDVKSYAAAYTKLSEEFYAVTHDAYNRVTMMAGTYRLNSRSNTDYWMSVNADNNAIGESSNSSTKQEWVFEATGAEGIFYIKNANTSRYLTTAVKSTQMVTTDNKAEAKGYKVDLVETGVMTLQCQDGDKQFLNRNGSTVLGWGDGNDHNSQWYITTVSVEQTAGKLHELNTLVNKTKELIDEMAEVTPTQKQTLLQTTSPSSPFYLSTNACHNTVNNASDGQGLAGLLDEDVATYFHSDYWNRVTDTHYLQVDMGASNLSDLAFYYTTRDNGDNCPTTIEVWGSTDGTTFNDKLYTFTGLPTDGAKTWESPMLSAANGYRSLRFMVTTAEGGNKFFVMSRFGFAKCEATVESMGEEYVAKGLTSDALISAYASIHKAQEKIMVGGATSDELTSLYDELSPKYAALEVIYNNAKNSAFNTRMDELKDWKDRLSLLIDQCGKVTYTPATYDGELALQTSNSNENWYVSTNADNNHSYEGTTYKDGDGIAALVDNNTNTYFHTRWQGEPVGEAHYIQVDMGEGVTIGDFMFSYTARDNSPAPTVMTIYGSNNVDEFKDVITTVNKDWADNNRDGVYTSDRIASPKAYRYLRFTVTVSNGPGNETFHNQYFFGMKEMDITAYGRSDNYTVTLGNEAGDVTEELLLTAYKAVQEAQSVVDYANTESQVQKAIDKLQAQCQALEDAKNSVVYVEYTIKTNVAGGGVIYKEKPYTTTLTAPNTLTESDLTAIGIEGYPNPEVTVNHETGVISVTYTLDKSALGDLLGGTRVLIDECGGFVNSEFVTENFDALLREANTAWDIAQEVYETVQTPSELSDALNALQTVHDKLYAAKESAKTEMRNQLSSLIRTTETLIYNCYEAETFLYEGSLNVTKALIAKTNEVLSTANKTYDSEFNAEDYESALHDLTIAKQNLATAIAYATLPVQLTFDASSPVTYKIKIARANTPVLAYDASSAMVAVTTYELGNKSHAWYFMATTDGKVLIMPYHDRNTTLALSTNDFTAGNSKVKGMPIGEEGYTQEWTITNANMNEANRNAGWYNITTINPTNTNTTWYFSNHGGASNKMGFYNDANDDGSRFQFEKVDFSKSDAYYTLSNYYHNEAKVSGTVTGGTAVGYYPEAAADAYNTAYSNAANVLEDAMATDEDYTNAYNALKAANEALNLIMPEVGTYYIIVSACGDSRGGQLMYALGDNTMKFSNEKTAQSPDALWTFTAEGYMMNLQTGCYVSTSGWGAQLTLVENGAKVVAIESLTTDGQVLLKPEGGYPLHAQDSGSKIVGYVNDNNASAWRIVKVDVNAVIHTATLKYEHAGLFLNYAVAKPVGVKAYYIDGTKEINIVDGVGELKLTELEGDVIPARTAVILYAPEIGNDAKTYDFYYTAKATDDVSENLLKGSASEQYVGDETSAKKYYIFGRKDENVGLYWARMDYTADGTYVGNDEGTHFKASANKVYLELDAKKAAALSGFRFRIGDEETGIKNVVIDADATIYDLYGRRVLEVVTPGLYIINGEKRYINIK